MLILVSILCLSGVSADNNCNAACRVFRNVGRNLENTFQNIAKEKPIVRLKYILFYIYRLVSL